MPCCRVKVGACLAVGVGGADDYECVVLKLGTVVVVQCPELCDFCEVHVVGVACGNTSYDSHIGS